MDRVVVVPVHVPEPALALVAEPAVQLGDDRPAEILHIGAVAQTLNLAGSGRQPVCTLDVPAEDSLQFTVHPFLVVLQDRQDQLAVGVPLAGGEGLRDRRRGRPPSVQGSRDPFAGTCRVVEAQVENGVGEWGTRRRAG